MALRIGLKDADGKLINDNIYHFEIFPQIDAGAENIYVLNKSGAAGRLTKELGVKLLEFNDMNCEPAVILIDSYDDYLTNRQFVDLRVENGTHVIFLELQDGKYQICDKTIEIKPSSFGPVNFASRKTGHPLVSDFEQFDFSLWHDIKTNRISPIANQIISAENLKPILISGNMDENSSFTPAIIAGEFKFGKGKYIINQLQLQDRISTNPVAKIYALRLLTSQNYD